MVLQLLINDTGHFFWDTEAGVQVGQAHRRKNGTWIVEVNDQWLKAPDLEAAKRLFLDHYDPSRVVTLHAVDLGGDEDEDDESEDEIDEEDKFDVSEFEVINLTDD
jgi:hypothetical protein